MLILKLPIRNLDDSDTCSKRVLHYSVVFRTRTEQNKLSILFWYISWMKYSFICMLLQFRFMFRMKGNCEAGRCEILAFFQNSVLQFYCWKKKYVWSEYYFYSKIYNICVTSRFEVVSLETKTIRLFAGRIFRIVTTTVDKVVF